ncbi:MAG: LPS assembly protein LptD [Pseudomonadota bacterium]
MKAGLAILCLAGLASVLPVHGQAQQRDDRFSAQVTQQAEQPAVLVADDIFLTADSRLVATGNVEALFGGRRLSAREIVYNDETGILDVSGPITIEEADGSLVLLADSAELDREMANGLLRGARLVFDDQIQLAAVELARTNGRYNQLFKVAVTSCRICNSDEPPLWQIRARQVIHDQQERQLYFNDAQLRVLGTPVLYLPRLRLPDPTLERATGFLVPTFRNSSLLGIGVEVPYFITLGDDKDLTVTPLLATETRTLQLRYRQAFRTGRIEFEGAVSDDDFGPDNPRAYIFGNGLFQLPHDFLLSFNIEAVSDKTYLLDYGFSQKDRLENELLVERARRDEYILGALTIFQSLRDGESNATLPAYVANGEYERRIALRSAPGGELRLGYLTHAHVRESGLVTDGPDLDPYADGRDVARFTFTADWLRTWVIGPGVLAKANVGLAIDHFEINQGGPAIESRATEVTPVIAGQLRWPLVKSAANGTRHVVEPVVQLAWAGGSNPLIPNDESTRVEFDEGNLFSTSRFPAPDRRERGLSAAYGLSWTRYGEEGWQTALAVGQVIRDETLEDPTGGPAFNESSGLRNRYSDLLVAGQIRNDFGLILTARGLFDDGFATTKAEARASWNTADAQVGATYIWLRSDPAEDRPGNQSEWAFDASYRLSRHWTGQADWRYDVASNESVTAGIGLTYTNECVDVTLSASRRFTATSVLEPSTDFSFTVGLRGFTTKTRDKSYTRTCDN